MLSPGSDPAVEDREGESGDAEGEPAREVRAGGDGGRPRVLVHGVHQLREGREAPARRRLRLCGRGGTEEFSSACSSLMPTSAVLYIDAVV